MDPRQDYFRSPAPKNIESFYSPFKLLRHDEDPIFINTLLSPFNKISNSPFSLYSQSVILENQSNNQLKPKQIKPIAKKIESVISFEKEESEEQEQSQKFQTPKKDTPQILNLETTSRKKYDLRIIEPHEKLHIVRDTERGLRTLSKQAFEIFRHSQPMTYQQVAERIIQQSEQLSEYPEKKKQRQSIKRRVYDALNVLIAVGRLQKVGKKIALSKRTIQQNQKNIVQSIDLQKQIEYKAKILQIKRKKLQQIKKQKIALKKLINRNQNEKHGNQKINFPFIIGSQFNFSTDKHITKIKEFVCADLQAIQKLKINGKK